MKIIEVKYEPLTYIATQFDEPFFFEHVHLLSDIGPLEVESWDGHSETVQVCGECGEEIC